MKVIIFRFCFIFFMLTTAPWLWLEDLPILSYIADGYYTLNEWLVTFTNEYLFQVKDTLNSEGYGSGDTSFNWAEFYTILLVSAIGCLVWTLVDLKRQGYPELAYWLRTTVRYFIAIITFSYGILKLFALQMPFPNISQLSTPLGDFLPMRLSWLFIGYSAPYQIFSGLMEVMVGILLFYRRTVTLGSLVGLGVFAHVFILNISYDIPVKLFSMQLMMGCLFLLADDWKRWVYFALNRQAAPTTLYDVNFSKRWQKIVWVIGKLSFVIFFVIIPIHENWKRHQSESFKGDMKPIKSGLYDVELLIKNRDTLTLDLKDEFAWKDFVFDKGGLGSVNTLDTIFWQRYRRGYFLYEPDSTTQIITFKRSWMDTTSILMLRYDLLGEESLVLRGVIRNDSVYFQLKRSNRHFQLAEKQFHWISERNR
ncbi:MAG: hypothetical protein KF687_00110 [Cyclobacteriaceae bacterium]|nr:hypothetical protein [Cyclobacteriaceae bacterium]